MKNKFAIWLNERIPIDFKKTSEVLSEAMREPIPKHMKNWFFALGATPLILFAIQAVTGILLTFYYVPSPEAAYESVRYITEEVSLGFWIRGMHRWGSNLMVITIFLHMVRVFITRGYRKPRELNWIIGMLLFFSTITLCFTGYSLVYNQLSYWAATVGTNMIKEIPLIGTPILEILRGGSDVTGNTLTRFFNLHVIFMPLVIVLLIIIHIVMVRLHGVSKLDGHEEEEESYPFYPEHFYHTLIIALFIISVISALSVILPPGLGEVADPSVTPNHIKPEWYFFGVYSLLKFVPIRLGIFLIAALIIVGTFWPFIEEIIRKKYPKAQNIHYWFATIALVLFLFFTIYEIVVV